MAKAKSLLMTPRCDFDLISPVSERFPVKWAWNADDILRLADFVRHEEVDLSTSKVIVDALWLDFDDLDKATGFDDFKTKILATAPGYVASITVLGLIRGDKVESRKFEIGDEGLEIIVLNGNFIGSLPADCDDFEVAWTYALKKYAGFADNFKLERATDPRGSLLAHGNLVKCDFNSIYILMRDDMGHPFAGMVLNRNMPVA